MVRKFTNERLLAAPKKLEPPIERLHQMLCGIREDFLTRMYETDEPRERQMLQGLIEGVAQKGRILERSFKGFFRTERQMKWFLAEEDLMKKTNRGNRIIPAGK